MWKALFILNIYFRVDISTYTSEVHIMGPSVDRIWGPHNNRGCMNLHTLIIQIYDGKTN